MILVTGASGFVGSAAALRLKRDGEHVRPVVRPGSPVLPELGEPYRVHSISAETDWTGALAGVSAVVHCAARVHVVSDRAADPLAEFRVVNVAGTARLARQAAAAGVRRFVFISSVKVNGERTLPGAPFLADSPPAPEDAYGISKLEAELELRHLAERTGMEVVVIRPVLAYGPGAKANFLTMMDMLRRGVPLPLGSIDNARSLVALDNLVDLVVTCVHHPAAPGQTFFVSDGEDLSTPELLRRTAAALGTEARLIPVPVSMLRLGARLVGQADIAQRLCDSLQVDIGKTRSLLGWKPPVSVDQALAQAAEHFLQARRR